MTPVIPFSDFSMASKAALEFLHDLIGFDLWMVTRTEGDDWIVLNRADHGYGVAEGTVFQWTDSFCSRMVEDKGPRIAPESNSIPAYAEAPIGRQVRIGAYIGIPLQRDDGSLFGTLCAINPTPMPESVRQNLALVELLGKLLSTILGKELKSAEESRRAERSEAVAMRDALTGLYNRRGWDRFLEAEEDRCRRYGHPACVIVIDLDGLKQVNDQEGHAAGDELIRRAGEALQQATRVSDVVARLGGDEFAILCVETNPKAAEQLTHRLKESFTEHEVMASIGFAMRRPDQGLPQAFEQADQAMYEAKKRRKSAPRP